MSKKAKAKTKSKSSTKKTKSKSKTKSASKKAAAKKTAKKKTSASQAASPAVSKPKAKAKPKASAPPKAAAAAAPLAAASLPAAAGPIALITQIAAQSPIVNFNWPDRGLAPKGYIKGMAVAFAGALCKLQAGDAATVEIAKAHTGNPKDVFTHYSDVFQNLGMSNAVAGPDTLRHLFVLMLGLGMRESSGRFCEGQDRHAPQNQTAEKAEAGLFQTSFDARGLNPLLPSLIAQYSANPAPPDFKDIFSEGVHCNAQDLENFGSGAGRDFQRLSKESPAFAAGFAAITLRNRFDHFGPIITKKAMVKADADTMLQQVQNLVLTTAGICAALT